VELSAEGVGGVSLRGGVLGGGLGVLGR
jgi:hypothetical protein